jgi:hypothetical protein
MKLKNFLIAFGLLYLPLAGLSQTQPQQIKTAVTQSFSKASTGALEKYFEGFVSVNMPGEKGFYSQSKAKWLLQDFFQKYPSKGFSLKESGFSGNNYYLIGQYNAGKSKWNVYFLFSPGNQEKFQIQQIDIEKIIQ